MDHSEIKNKESQQADTEKETGKPILGYPSELSCQSDDKNNFVDATDFPSRSDLKTPSLASTSSFQQETTGTGNKSSDFNQLHNNAHEECQDVSQFNEHAFSKSVLNSSETGDEEASDAVSSDGIYVSTSTPSYQQNVGTTSLTEKCTEHDELIKMFCRQHDEVCCSACIALYHRTCDGVFFIPKLNRSFLEEEEEITASSSLENVLRELHDMKQQRVEDLEESERDWADDLEEIKKLKEHLTAKIEELEMKAENEIKERRNTVCLGLKDDIAMIQDMIQTTETKLESLKHLKKQVSPAEFVEKKISKKLLAETKTILAQMRETKPEVMKFHLDKGLQTYLIGYKSFGELQALESGCTATPLGKYCLRTVKDCAMSSIFDLSITDNDTVLVTEFAKNELKRLDMTCMPIEKLSISGGPFGICNISPNQVAVTVLNKKRVQFVDLSSSMKKGNTFSVGVRCRGICHSRGELFISCGGCVYMDDSEGPGHIRVFTMAGKIVRTIQFDTHDQQIFDIPRHLTTSPDGELLYVADNRKGLFVITRDGKVKDILNEKTIKQPYGVCLGEGNRIFVCSIDTHLAYQLDSNGKVVYGPLGRADGIYRPTTIKYCPKRRELLIASGNGNLVVFSMVTETEI